MSSIRFQRTYELRHTPYIYFPPLSLSPFSLSLSLSVDIFRMDRLQLTYQIEHHCIPSRSKFICLMHDTKAREREREEAMRVVVKKCTRIFVRAFILKEIKESCIVRRNAGRSVATREIREIRSSRIAGEQRIAIAARRGVATPREKRAH